MTAGGDLYRIWVYLSETPLLWLTATLLAFAIGDAASLRFRRHPLTNPVVIAAGLLILVLIATGTPYQAYFQGAQFVHFLLGPATVALGLPLWRNRLAVRRNFLPMTAALLAGSLTAIGSAVVIGWVLGAPGEILASLAAKSVTAPIAMGLNGAMTALVFALLALLI